MSDKDLALRLAEKLEAAFTSIHDMEPSATELRRLHARVAELEATINTPHTADWMEAVQLEAAHQQERWGSDDDAGKSPSDWVALCIYLLGKCTKAYYDADREKMLHHVISTSAVLLNFHRNATNENTRMRPGVAATHSVLAIDAALQQEKKS